MVKRQQEDKFLIPDPLKLGLVFERYTAFVQFEKPTMGQHSVLYISIRYFKGARENFAFCCFESMSIEKDWQGTSFSKNE